MTEASRSRHLVDPELSELLDLFPRFTLDTNTLSVLRGGSLLSPPVIPNPERVEKHHLTAPGLNGAPDIGLILYRPAKRTVEPLPCIYHIHGGGYVGGSAGGSEPTHRAMVEAIGCILISIGYRLAPETPYPGPLDDCLAGLLWLVEQEEEWGVDTARIALSGESAGGGLAAGLALRLRDSGGPKLVLQHLIYPMLDDRTVTLADPHPYAGEFVWNPGSNAFGWQSYLGAEPGSDDIPAYASAARATNLSGLPPTFISTGSLDLFAEENMAYATRLIRAGVPTELHVYPGGFHAFDRAPMADVAKRMRRDSWDALRRHLHR